MRTKELLQVQERNLNVGGWLQKITKLRVENKDSSVVRVLKTVSLDVLVNRTSHSASRNELSLRKVEEYTQLLRDLLLAVETVVLGAVSRLLTSRVVLLSLDLSNNLGERLKFVTERGDFGEYRFNGHCILLMLLIFKYVSSKNVCIY